MADLDAAEFERRLREHQSDDELRKIQRYFKDGTSGVFLGVRMGTVFALAKEFIELPPAELERLLESDVHELRAGALSVMDKQARRKRTPPDRRRELYELYLRRHDRIDNWDLVDLAAPHVVGGYLADQPRDVLYELARSPNRWERRTAITATAYFIRAGDVGDTFAIAELLLDDPEDLVHKATGGWLRAAGDHDRDRLLAFLDRHAATMPRVMLRYAIEHLEPAQREHYRAAATSRPGR
ncbi:DNA alkylation repair protein [Jiangella sp. DSM 45060]|uniref:DNA alkylation repair protein n=1 Tax=Jiangella sp. DSM 45060 TaxID=1798224 RepID=UPI00087A34E9|nr:DNA alkylation repair protein [Jiangella sp. DSM 45060]SDT49029.1 3-methyladenine DNA glycosylase AlkD [Jiangella sp. DSM 45060]